MRVRFPHSDDAPEVGAVKRLAARCGRTHGQAEAHRAACMKLRELLRTLETGRLRYWAQVMMIDGRWCGATGTGAYWAVASRCVNEQAWAVLRDRGREWRERYGDALFVEVSP